MLQVIESARAVAVTVSPGTDADFVFGPHVEAVRGVHSQTGRPTNPAPSGVGADRIVGPRRRMLLMAVAARSNCGTRPPNPGGGAGNHCCRCPPLPGRQ